MAKALKWEEQAEVPTPRGTQVIRGICGTHVYRVFDEGVGPFLLVDNQNGHDCFSMRVASVNEAQREAQNHFDELVKEMIN